MKFPQPLAAVLLGTALGSAAARCTPRLPPVSGCAPRAWRCSPSGRPEVCSATQRWEPAGDVPCSAVWARCVVADGGPAHCAPADGGAP